MDACGVDAIYRRDDGLVIIDPEACTGCGDCVDACPYAAIYFNKDLNIAQKCTGCAHLLDNDYKLPRCVEACPTDAILFGEEEDLQDFIVGATVRQPKRVTIPGSITATSPASSSPAPSMTLSKKRVVIGARVRATNGGKTVEVLSDEYGDFWLKDLAMGKYDVVIEAPGYDYKVFDNVDATKDVNLGDIPLDKTKS